MSDREMELLQDMRVIAAMKPEKVAVESRNDAIARIAVEHAISAIRMFNKFNGGERD